MEKYEHEKTGLDRRRFLKGSVAAAIGTVAGGSASVLAAETPPYLAGILHWADNEGRWKGKSGSHAPQVSQSGSQVTVVTKHGMSEAHFIVRHTLVTEEGVVLGSRTFTPADKEARSSFEVKAEKGAKVYATSFCNLHDMWVTEYSLS